MFKKTTYFVIAVFALLTIFSFQAYAADKIVGSWKVTIEGAPANSPAIFLLSVQQGGIVNIAQANAFRSMAVGHWNKVGGKSYQLQDTHLMYEDVSPYPVFATEEHFVEVKLDKGGQTFSGVAQLVATDLYGVEISNFFLDIVGVRLPEADF